MWGRLRRDARGSVTILAAAGLVMTFAAAGLAVDLGSVFYESRRLQGMADAAALSAAGNLASPAGAAGAAITAAGWSRAITPAVTLGTWTADPARGAAVRFVASGASPNAAQVRLTMDTPLYFGRTFGLRSIHIGRSATAARVDLASFSIASRLASLDGGVANQLLGGLTGTTVSLTANDYDALLGADVDLLALSDGLRTELSLGAMSYQQALQAQTTLPRALAAVSRALTASGQATAAAATSKLGGMMPGTPIRLGSLIDLGALGKQDHASAGQSVQVNAFDLVAATLQQGGGARQFDLDLGATIPGASATRVTLAIGERPVSSPWVAITATGDPVIHTAQTRLAITLTLPGSAALKLLGIGSLRLPLYVELAEAQAKLSSLSCSANTRSATLQVLPSPGHASIADVTTTGLSDMHATPVERPATFFDILGFKGTGTARIDLASGDWQSVPFSVEDIAARTTKTVRSSGFLAGIAGSLLTQLQLGVTAGVLQSPSPSTAALAKPVLDAAAAPLDQLLSALLDQLGIHLGQAEVRINGVRCGAAALVA